MIVDVFALLSIVVYVIVCPYTKVEESFNMQAMYDHLHFGWNLSSYDHLQFPGVVPRTFLGSLCISAVSSPFVFVAKLANIEGIFQQMIVRIILGIITWLSLVRLRQAIQNRFSRRAAQIFMIFSSLQFHLCFYASRSLPNTFAVIFAALSFAAWLNREPIFALQLIGIATVIFRCDMLILTGALALVMLLGGEIPFLSTIIVGLRTCLGALLVTVSIDSFFWKQFMWPEGVVLFFNTVENKSSEWGVSPWHWYVSAAVPKSLTMVLPWVLLCVFVAMTPLPEEKLKKEDSGSCNDAKEADNAQNWQLTRQICRISLYYLTPAVIFIALYSVLPHKELRFIMPVLPLFTITAAVTADQVLQNFCASRSALIFPLSALSISSSAQKKAKNKTFLGGIVQLALLGSWILMMLLSHTFLLASQHNYPGGEAIEHFLHYFVRSEASVHMHLDPHQPAPHPHDHYLPRLEPTFVHIDNLAATTGVTRFLQDRFVHHRYFVPESNRPRRKNKAESRKRTVEMQYPPHIYLNSLPSTWHKVLQNESEYQYRVMQQEHIAEEDLILSEDLLVYSKEEYLLDIDKTEFDFLITEEPDEFLQSGQFVLREAIAGFERMQFTKFGPKVILKNKLFILENAYPHHFVED